MKTKAGAISSGRAARPIAVPAPNFAASWGGRSAGLSGVQTGARRDGVDAEPRSINCTESDFVKA